MFHDCKHGQTYDAWQQTIQPNMNSLFGPQLIWGDWSIFLIHPLSSLALTVSLLCVIACADPFMMPHMQVDKGAIKFILSGANIMCPGLTSPGARMTKVETDTPVVSFAYSSLSAGPTVIFCLGHMYGATATFDFGDGLTGCQSCSWRNANDLISSFLVLASTRLDVSLLVRLTHRRLPNTSQYKVLLHLLPFGRNSNA